MKNIVVVGSGTMGNGIAHVFALKGHKVDLVDISEEALQRARQSIEKNLDRQLSKEQISADEKQQAQDNLNYSGNLEKSLQDADLMVEAVSERVDLKLNIFKKADEICGENTILASNTSSISITKIAAATSRPDKVIGMHFMNPVPVMKLVEIINGYGTSKETTDQITELSKKLGKVPVEVNDYPGFVANRILMPMINEAVYSLYEGVAGVEEIDTVMKLGMAHPMGPLQLADFIGLDVCHSILNVLYEGLGNQKYAPCPLLTNMVLAGNLGIKSKRGFYDYSHGGRELIVAEKFRK